MGEHCDIFREIRLSTTICICAYAHKLATYVLVSPKCGLRLLPPARKRNSLLGDTSTLHLRFISSCCMYYLVGVCLYVLSIATIPISISLYQPPAMHPSRPNCSFIEFNGGYVALTHRRRPKPSTAKAQSAPIPTQMRAISYEK